MASAGDKRLAFQEAMHLERLPPTPSKLSSQRFMSTRAAYVPGIELPSVLPRLHEAAYGGVVYGQATVAACQTLRELEDKKGIKASDRLGLHTIHGYFTAMGKSDRPFIYEVTPTAETRTFSTFSVAAYQPSVPSTTPQRDYFPIEDASLPPGPTSFTAMCSFKAPEQHTQGISTQEPSPQARFASILASRPLQDWSPAPIIDIEGVLGFQGSDKVGLFPIVEMKKVDMTAFNEGKPVHERAELILYRLLKPLPSDGTGGYDANSHAVVHAFTADRNGLLMAGNHLGLGFSFGRAASLSYSFVFHVNADETVMRDGEDQWWIQEATFPRAGAGRGIVLSKIWSPQGLHVATEYQDGIIRAYEERKTQKL